VARKRRPGQPHRSTAAVSATSRVKPSRPAQPEPKPQPLWRNALGGTVNWTWGVVTAVVVSLVTAVVTGFVSRPAATGNTTVRHGPPVRIDSVTVLRTTVQAGTYMFQRPLHLSQSDLRSLNKLQNVAPAYDAWFRSRGGVDPDSSNVELVVEGNADQAARITNITLLKSCQAPLTGTLFLSPPAGSESAILIDFNLDSTRSVALTPGGQDYFSKYTIALRPGEVQVIQITAHTNLHYCRYTLQLTVLVGTHKTIETVTNAGKPFQVSALYSSLARYHALYVGGIMNPHTGNFVQKNPSTYHG